MQEPLPGEMSAPNVSKGVRFWAVIAALSMTSLLSALENTVVSTSLPTIAALLDIGRDYSWVTNAFFLTRYVLSSPPSSGVSSKTQAAPLPSHSLDKSQISSAGDFYPSVWWWFSSQGARYAVPPPAALC